MVLRRPKAIILVLVLLVLIFSSCTQNDQTETPEAENESIKTDTIEPESTEEVEEKADEKAEQTQEDEDVNTQDMDNLYIEYTSGGYSQENMGENLISNSSVEIEYGIKRPHNFLYGSFGNHEVKFSYPWEGHTGNRSIKIEVTDHVNGDSKWHPYPVHIYGKEDFYYSEYYRSNVETIVKVRLYNSQGDIKYMNLKNAPASEEWTKYETFFVVPDDTIALTVEHIISDDGYVIIDDLFLAEYTYEGFEQGMVTLTFDDGWKFNYDTALPIMREYGYKSNQFYGTDTIRNANSDFAEEAINMFIDAGHEIGSHSVNHINLTTLSEKEITIELMESKLFLKNFLGIEANYFAAPYGLYDEYVSEEIMKHYYAHRTVDYGYNSKENFNISQLKSISVKASTTLEEFKMWIEKAQEQNLWLILLFHEVTDDHTDYGVSEDMFAEFMEALSEYDIEVVTISEGLEIISSQNPN